MYEEVSQLSDKGKYTNSKLQGTGKRMFDHERRENQIELRARKNLNPGPGSYRSPSDFGHYDGNVYGGKSGGISYIAPGKTTRTSSKMKL